MPTPNSDLVWELVNAGLMNPSALGRIYTNRSAGRLVSRPPQPRANPALETHPGATTPLRGVAVPFLWTDDLDTNTGLPRQRNRVTTPRTRQVFTDCEPEDL